MNIVLKWLKDIVVKPVHDELEFAYMLHCTAERKWDWEINDSRARHVQIFFTGDKYKYFVVPGSAENENTSPIIDQSSYRSNSVKPKEKQRRMNNRDVGPKESWDPTL